MTQTSPNEYSTKPLTLTQLLKLGAGLGIAWGLIFAGFLANMQGRIWPAAQWTAAVMLIVIGIMFVLPQYLYRMQEIEEKGP